MAKANIFPSLPSASAGSQSSYFDNQGPIGISKTAAAANVVRLRPTTVLTTRKHSRRANADDKRAYLTEAEVERLIKAAETPRDKAMILIGYRHGLRVSELVNLRWQRVDLDAGRLQVERLKGSESGVHPLSGREIRALRSLRRGQPPGSAFVFLSYKGAPMTRQAFDKVLRAAGAKAGLPDVHAHLLRHGCGFRLVNLGLDTLSLAAYLGHKQVQNTKRYAKMNSTRFDFGRIKDDRCYPAIASGSRAPWRSGASSLSLR
jgi:type 1 fimbriae regulatory protein FimB/type 1 fimbriae regulatory protein FimE